MKKRQQIKLLTKTTSIYLIFTFVAFFFSALFLINESGEYINRELEGRFKWTEGKITSEIKKFGKPRRERSSVKVTNLRNVNADLTVPVYTDTLIQTEEREQMLLHRKKTTFINVEGKYYKLEMLQNISDFKRLQDDILQGLVPSFIILAIVIVLFNYFLSGFFFSPFNKILNQMKNYKVGKGSDIPNIHTSTSEFLKMQQLFQNMIHRTENEYRTLKEYTENVAHEIQTPLTVIRNKTENLISDNNVMSENAKSVKTIYDEVNHLSKLGTALNLLTKVEHGEFNNNVEIRTKDVITKHMESISELVELKSLKFELNLSEKHTINIDPILLDIVLNNLIKNSINYATLDGPIKIETDEKSFSISNYGSPLEFPRERVFSRFSKKNNSASSLGLGLALVYKICQKNNLHIEYFFNYNLHQFIISARKLDQ